MLYDEEGRAFIEPPLIPDDQRTFYIVDDYQRMFSENTKLERRNEKLRESISKMNQLVYAQYWYIRNQHKALEKLVKMLKSRGATVPKDVLELIKQYNWHM